MATFYPNSSAQLDVVSSPYIQDQKFTSYSDSPMIHGNLMMYLNEASEICPATSMSNEMMFIPPTGAISDTITHPVDGEQNLQGLSLSLSTQLSTTIQPSSFHHLSNAMTNHLPDKVDGSFEFNGDGQSFIRFGAQNNLGYNGYQYEQVGSPSNIMKSKYLKATQQLLDEIVSVQDALKKTESFKEQNMGKVEEKSEPELDVNESTSASSKELSATERQELQNKLHKLLIMLDEADRRYKQYCHQMQVLVSSFDLVAGNGGAKTYTTLARKTISRHFRSLRDSISVQIQNTRKCLGEQDSGQGGVIPRLRHVDLQLRRQRALQQFGMMRHAWRPQRGLPENAVTTLRAWLFEHFLNPYPKDSEKIMLARQTGLTRGQVANWFINARVRLWKPMVEEIYKEEIGDGDDLNFKSSPENTPKATGEKSWVSEDRQSIRPIADTRPNHEDYKTNNVYHNITDMNQSTGREGMMVSPHGGEGKHNLTNHGFYPHDQNSLISFQVPELGNYGVNNQVSLALGLSDETSLVQHRFSSPHSLLNDFVV